ncbi:zinc-ribbon domain-containing protein [Aestuariivirga litoralis]|uniref:zinc-ribbon domain-containing protein n=1 Tax=Aestuariivirga litoralis TaxID=2650924 RepID=UPI0018C6532D|nr:zinc-ribbon domain-containing protein [Aestuariivirga litoralis]MBG1233704.1 hypothetical protein [Aestuariivirga litoralis]
MIVSCPSCTTRYNIGAHAGHEPFKVTCNACGHHWQELPVIEIKDITDAVLPATFEEIDEHQFDVGQLVEAARNVRQDYKARQMARTKTIGGWASFALVAASPFLFAAIAPEATVLAAPVTAGAYAKFGHEINLYGLNIAHVEQVNKSTGGQHVLTVKGEISNPTEDIRKIPSLRFALTDEKGVEVYTWTLDTAARPLRPGETTAFTTRVSSPPELAQKLQIRFAHADEIGSNPTL